MVRLLPLLATLMLVGLAPAAVAKAPQTNAPPGNSAIDQYLETVPGATGNQNPGPPQGGAGNPGSGGSGGSAGGAGGAGSGSAPLTAAQRARLQRLGPDGKTLANVVDSTSPRPTAPTSHKPPRDARPPAGSGRSPLSQVVDAATGKAAGDGGMGLLLPAILLASLLGFIALVVVRRRSAS